MSTREELPYGILRATEDRLILACILLMGETEALTWPQQLMGFPPPSLSDSFFTGEICDLS